MIHRPIQWLTCAIAVLMIAASAVRGQAPVTETFSFGGNGLDEVSAIAVDSANNIYIAGQTSSTNLPGSERGFQKRNQGTDGFIAKLNARGEVLWSS